MHDLLDQDEYWIMRDGLKIRLEDMDYSHRENVLNLLVRRADYQRKLYLLREQRMFLSAPDDVYESYLEEVGRELVDDPQAWLERRPLVKKLRQLQLRDGAIDGEVVVNELSAPK